MDPVRAKRMSDELINQRIGGWLIHRYINAGKSAIVFEGGKEGQRVALKVYDPELVERFGKSTQIGRIERECSLIGQNHPNLVPIFDGGECAESGYLYVAMECIDAPNLKESLTLVPREKIAHLIHQIASAARFLENKELAHRDIKPENIAVFPDFSRAVLLDLGVLRPFGDPGLTDDEARTFIGTLRYSSPEFLIRTEKDTPDGWRAITFYQLGAVLHDLIMRQPLFEKFSDPYGLLVLSIQNEKPLIQADDVSADLILLAQNCLVKPPGARLTLVSWDDFDLPSETQRSTGSAKERVKKRALLIRSQAGGTPSTQRLPAKQVAQCITQHLDCIIRNECAGSDSCPPIQLIRNIDGQIQIRVIVTASHAHALPHQLSIRFDCDLVDEATLSLSIDVSACLQQTGSSHGDPPAPAHIFRGALDSGSLTERVQNILWLSIDLAQRQGTLPQSGDDELWLNLIQELEGKK